MARPLRIEFSNAWYHVMNRGRWRENIFYTDEDKHVFLSLLADLFERFHVQIHAYCLMSNHYHLLLNTPLPNLQRAMRHLGGLYTQQFNRAHEKEGSLFRGRYKSKLVDSDEYLTQLSRYIHMNPVDAGMVNSPEDYEWSSYRFFLQQADKPKWLFCDETLAYFGNKSRISMIEKYQSYVNKGVDEELLARLTGVKSRAILGSDEFIKSMALKINQTDTLEIPDHKPVIRLMEPSLSTIQKVTANYYQVPSEEINKSKQYVGNLPRRVAIYMASKHTSHSHQTIANFFGKTSRYGVARAFYELSCKRDMNTALAQAFSEIEADLHK